MTILQALVIAVCVAYTSLDLISKVEGGRR